MLRESSSPAVEWRFEWQLQPQPNVIETFRNTQRPWRLLLLIFCFRPCHYRNNLLFISIISDVIMSSTCRIIFSVIFFSSLNGKQKKKVSHKILYHTRIHRELKVLLIPHKQLHLSSSSSRLLDANPTNKQRGVIMTLNPPGRSSLSCTSPVQQEGISDA